MQIYEPILGDAAGRVTTGLISAVGYLKDNRILPAGFDKTAAPAEIAVRGGALEDGDFTAGADTIVYSVDAGAAAAPFSVEAELLYQSIGYRWARNLAAYDAPEPQRFARMYAEHAGSSAKVIARASTD